MTKDCKKKSIWARLIVIAVLACTASNAQAQLIAGRTNALLWGNLTPELLAGTGDIEPDQRYGGSFLQP